MIKIIYVVILIYFILGGLGFYLINRNKDAKAAKKSYTKFGVYFVIINILFFSIAINSIVFRCLSVLIITAGVFELIKLFKTNGFQHKSFFVIAFIIFMLFSTGFYFFGRLNKELILFSFLILSIFDSFSQITGQLWGRKKIVPDISPNKTIGGLTGGTIIAIMSALLLHKLYSGIVFSALLMAAGIVAFAFLGDLLASLYKRKYSVKDYSNLIPGHGGFLDRFDSLIAGGAWVAFSIYILNI